MTVRVRAGETPPPHFVSTDPFDPYAVETMTARQERYYQASQWKLMWWRFARHRIAVVSAAFLLLLYGSVLISEVLAPYGLETRNPQFLLAPPQPIHFFHDGKFVGPFVYGLHYSLNMENLRREYTDEPNAVMPIRFFCQGDRYWFWGRIEARFHVICPAEGGTMFLLGTDRLGRDMLSRIIYGARI